MKKEITSARMAAAKHEGFTEGQIWDGLGEKIAARVAAAVKADVLASIDKKLQHLVNHMSRRAAFP
jgi:hypothetical protein